jgi:hypothetical protein
MNAEAQELHLIMRKLRGGIAMVSDWFVTDLGPFDCCVKLAAAALESLYCGMTSCPCRRPWER